jgi:hypothetical protein
MAERTGQAWFVGIILALALLAIAGLVYSANSQSRPWQQQAQAEVKK